MARTVLIADDSSTIRKIVELSLSNQNTRVESAASGAEALEKLRTVSVDLVLADVVMPEPSGYELCRAIKSSDQPRPVVLLAGTFEPFDREAAQACGADDCLVKPFESKLLVEKIERLLGGEAAATHLGVAHEDDEPEEALAVPARDDQAPQELGAVAAEDQLFDAEPADRPAATVVRLSSEEIDAVARAVVERLSCEIVREIVHEVVPDLTTRILRDRIEKLENDES